LVFCYSCSNYSQQGMLADVAQDLISQSVWSWHTKYFKLTEIKKTTEARWSLWPPTLIHELRHKSIWPSLCSRGVLPLPKWRLHLSENIQAHKRIWASRLAQFPLVYHHRSYYVSSSHTGHECPWKYSFSSISGVFISE
jgi:hypothetical protein